MPIKIAIAEDNSFALSALLERLKGSDLHIKHIARNGRELIGLLQKDSRVDLILMDIQMPEMDGIEATTIVKTKYPQIKVLMLTMFDDDENLFSAVMAGASGYLLKEDNSVEILRAINDTMAGGAAMSPFIALRTLNLIRNPPEDFRSHQNFGLTQREIELLTHLKNGLTYEEIAANLIISYHTVRKHIENIYRKMQVSNKVEAIQKAKDNRIT
jgi:DNA-binding NarL/FixJ family response regulator